MEQKNDPRNNNGQQGGAQAPSGGGQNRNRRNNNHRRRHGGGGQGNGRNPMHKEGDQRHPQAKKVASSTLSDMNSIFKKYDHLQELHIHARRKLFELYFRAEYSQLDKLELNYHKSLEEIARFEHSMTDYQKQRLAERDGGRIDTTYSSTHSLKSAGELEPNLPPIEIHLLPSQKARPLFREDKEETKGSDEEYLKYKGLSV